LPIGCRLSTRVEGGAPGSEEQEEIFEKTWKALKKVELEEREGETGETLSYLVTSDKKG